MNLQAYWIGRYPVTTEEYRLLLEANGDQKQPSGWNGIDATGDEARHPVHGLSWDAALAYCHWLSEVTGRHYALPSEAEWEKAARGTHGRIYPWGNGWDHARCNNGDWWHREGREQEMKTTLVNAFSPHSDSPYGAADMIGNCWEWTRSSAEDYPYDPDDGREDLTSVTLPTQSPRTAATRQVSRPSAFVMTQYIHTVTCRRHRDDWVTG